MTGKSNTPDIMAILTENRPSLTSGSKTTYTSIIRNVYPIVVGKDKGGTTSPANEMLKHFTEKYTDVLDALKEMSYAKRKTILAALLVFVGGNETPAGKAYHAQMVKDSDSYNAEQREQKKTDKQEKNWVSQSEVMEKLTQLEKQYKHLLAKKDLSMFELQSLMNLIILSVYTLIPPRRIKDYVEFKVRNVDESNDNYMSGNRFFFNQYKTKSRYGKQEVKIPQKLRILIQKWASKFPYDYLLFNEKGEPIPQSRLTQRLNRIFDGRKISVNGLRHAFITDTVLKNAPALKELDQVAKDMGHSTDQQALYKKL